MKKFLFLFIVSTFSILSLIGCSDDSSNAPSTTGNDGFVGTYDITYFGTVATHDGSSALSKISTDCTKFNNSDLGKKFPDTSFAKCEAGTRVIGGKITISKEGDNYKVTSKLQIIGPYFTSGFGVAGQTDTYQYTAYAPVPASEVTDKEINVTGKVLGVSGRNLTVKTDNPKSTFKIKKGDNGNIFVDMELKDKAISPELKVSAPTNVEAKKISETVEVLDPNSLFETKFDDPQEQAVFQKFVKDPQ